MTQRDFIKVTVPRVHMDGPDSKKITDVFLVRNKEMTNE